MQGIKACGEPSPSANLRCPTLPASFVIRPSAVVILRMQSSSVITLGMRSPSSSVTSGGRPFPAVDSQGYRRLTYAPARCLLPRPFSLPTPASVMISNGGRRWIPSSACSHWHGGRPRRHFLSTARTTAACRKKSMATGAPAPWHQGLWVSYAQRLMEARYRNNPVCKALLPVVNERRHGTIDLAGH